jgi:hypothetical protein
LQVWPSILIPDPLTVLFWDKQNHVLPHGHSIYLLQY